MAQRQRFAAQASALWPPERQARRRPIRHRPSPPSAPRTAAWARSETQQASVRLRQRASAPARQQRASARVRQQRASVRQARVMTSAPRTAAERRAEAVAETRRSTLARRRRAARATPWARSAGRRRAWPQALRQASPALVWPPRQQERLASEARHGAARPSEARPAPGRDHPTRSRRRKDSARSFGPSRGEPRSNVEGKQAFGRSIVGRWILTAVGNPRSRPTYS
jgi:hypothetical protein